jgi:glycerol uptake facilitator-like aquaporin
VDAERSLPNRLGRVCLAEALGTALLIVAVIGSGIMASKLSPSDTGLQLLENALATGGALVALILLFATVSGAQFNPIVTLSFRIFGEGDNRTTTAVIASQLVGGCVGAIVANAMFERPTFEWSSKVRSGGPIWLSEVVASFGLLLVIHGIVRSGKAAMVPFAVGAWITGAYWFTSSTSFANPAVTMARTLSDSFAGIAPKSAPMFIAMQFVGMALALVAISFLYPKDLGSVSNV